MARDTARFRPTALAALAKRVILTRSFHCSRGGRSITFAARGYNRLKSHEARAVWTVCCESGSFAASRANSHARVELPGNWESAPLRALRAQARAGGGRRFPERAWTIPRGTLMRKILIMGLPGAGKTTLATALAPLINAVVFNADGVRANLPVISASATPTGSSMRAAWGGCAIGSSRRAARSSRISLPDRRDARRFRRRLHDLGRPYPCRPLRGHQPDVRRARTRRPSRRRRRHPAILGRAGAGPAASGIRSAEADGVVPRTLSAVPPRASAPDRGGSAPRRPGLHRRA